MIVGAFALLCGTAIAQTAASDPVLMTVDGVAVPRSEFEAIYKKNNKEAPVTKEALDEYLELFINYKLKVREAEVLGMDTIAKFRAELDGYRTQLARPYLIDRELNDALMREAYDRIPRGGARQPHPGAGGAGGLPGGYAGGLEEDHRPARSHHQR